METVSEVSCCKQLGCQGEKKDKKVAMSESVPSGRMEPKDEEAKELRALERDSFYPITTESNIRNADRSV